MIGYAGKIIHISLDDLEITKAMTSDYTECKGVVGDGYDILFSEICIKKSHDENNRLIFACHPMTDVLVSQCNGEVVKLSVSPPTYLSLGQSSMAEPDGLDAYWGRELRYSGHDAIIIQGQAAKPVYIFINDDQVEIKPADLLWDLDALNAKEKIYRDLNINDVKILIMDSTAGGRTARPASDRGASDLGKEALVGMMMAAKNLKAVAIKGTKRWSQIFRRYVRL